MIPWKPMDYVKPEILFNKNTVFFIAVTMVMVLMVWFGKNSSIIYTPNLNYDPNVEYVSGRVVEVIADETAINDYGMRTGAQQILVKIMSGSHKGEIIEITNRVFMENSVYAKAGQRLNIYFYAPPASDTPVASVRNYERSTTIYLIIGFFIFLLALVGGVTGIRSAFGLIFTFVVILFLLIPLIVQGWSPAGLSLGLGFVIIVISLISILGFTTKTYVCMISTGIGVAICGLFYLIFSKALHITGYNADDIDALLVIMQNSNIQVADFLFCGILIASLGAILDVTVSIASSIEELSVTNPKSDERSLFRSGMNIGRDIIGATSNTLILAFAGTFFISLIIFRINKFNYHMLISSTDIGIEVLRAIAASTALILVAPVTAFIGSKVYGKK